MKFIKNFVKDSLDKQGYVYFNKKFIAELFNQNNIIVISLQRSGSTWMLDALRCHPLIEMNISKLFHQLLVDNNTSRYPFDLSNKIDCDQLIEQTLGNYVRIPSFNINLKNSFNLKKLKENKEYNFYNIEKVHPKFFAYNTELFTKLIERILKINIDNKSNLKFIYTIRDPKQIISSMINYNKRNKDWGKNQIKNKTKLFESIKNSFLFINNINKIFPGIIVDYNVLKTNTEDQMYKIFSTLWNKNTKINKLNKLISKKILYITNRKRRKINNIIFFGDQENDSNNVSSELEKIFNNNKHILDEIYEIYYNFL